MFKYLRTLNTEFHPTSVELFLSPANEDELDGCSAGTICSVSDGTLTPYYKSGTVMYLTLIEKEEDTERTVSCIRLTSNMVLEADVMPDADSSKLGIGAAVSLGYDDDSKAVGISTEGTPRFEVIDNSAIMDNKVTVAVL